MKFIAALCMLIDHIGFAFYPDDLRWRIIGRLAMPIFAYGIARGAFYTASLKRYMKKMLLFSFVSQVPFWAMQYMGIGGAFFSLRLNVGFTFLLALMTIVLLNESEIGYKKLKEVSIEHKEPMNKVFMLGGAFCCIVLADLLKCDYGSYGVLMVLMGYFIFLKGEKLWMMIAGYLGLTILFYNANISLCLLQSIGVLSYAIIYRTRCWNEKKFGKYFYIFYPLHMLIIAGVKWWQINS
ncbi:MAG: hypothetical protein E7231_18325 [Cellulosilyticum sp.]|nr:hypothetical protein [Cellulosilyticum sp.]